ncbi:hypothetical protein BDD43_2930 [Mucilaginibacter gracilis]|uniref:Uncharacterized protein n=1 Tax=Mucilaginibacter gracilis TaxID=423350 RepID=A0A495J175_9SPHI|nr:hypothetical protein [Mucilaginibacter gracilis]RKR82745.1 hypothetical protein BDD43_2930 [Mucilaginibacter gracilis]
MEDEKKQYHFVNSQTGYVIAYLSIPVDTYPEALTVMLEKRRKELAVQHGIYVETIYWEEKKL